MTLRRRIAERVGYLAGLRDFATFLETTKFPYHVPEFTLTYVVRSKAEADKIIASFAPAARPLWRNGIYMAELEPARLGAAKGPDGVVFDIHFAPPITEQDAA